MQVSKQNFVSVLAALLLAFAASGIAQASPPPPPPPPASAAAPASPAAPFDVCRDRSKLNYVRSFFFIIRPCTIVVGPKGRKLELGSVSGPDVFKDAKGKQQRPTKAVFRSFVPVVPAARTQFDMIAIKQTGRTVRVALPNRLPSVIDPYIVFLPRSICRADGWLVSVAISDGTETKPFGVINSMCGPHAPKP